MARFTTSTAAADPVRPYIEGVAKSLVDRLYGAEGPAWGTKMTELEDTVLAIRQVLTEKMLDEALQRQAKTVENRPEEFRACPQCGQGVEAKKRVQDPPPRTMQTRGGETEWLEPEMYCHKCRRSFFPSEQEFGHRPDHVESGVAAESQLRGDQ